MFYIKETEKEKICKFEITTNFIKSENFLNYRNFFTLYLCIIKIEITIKSTKKKKKRRLLQLN